MKIPCKTCLKYAICISQKQLSCDDLQDFFNNIHIEMKEVEISKLNRGKQYVAYLSFLHLEQRNKAWDNTWEQMYKHFPNLESLFRGTSRQQMAAVKRE